MEPGRVHLGQSCFPVSAAAAGQKDLDERNQVHAGESRFPVAEAEIAQKDFEA